MISIGEKDKLAFELGEYWKNSLQNQHIDIWLGGKNITSIDNLAYLPTFYTNLKNDIEKIANYEFLKEGMDLSDEALYKLFESSDADQHRILMLDLTIMAARSYYIYLPDASYIIFSYWDPRHDPQSDVGLVFPVDIEKNELLSVLEKTLDNISTKWY